MEKPASSTHGPARRVARPPRHAPQALVECTSFAQLAQRAHTLEALDRALRQTLPQPLRDQVRFADVRHERLVFLANSPAWASRLRLAQGQILACARAIGVAAGAIKVKVVAPSATVTATAAAGMSISAAAAAHLRAAAGGLQDPELRAMFLTLAAQADQRPSRGS
ncbi:MAG: DUF721 domain-containing protein [Xanthomonadales bacterium]|nr:DUF721 domain-containing protein [Xanthomonadales bacterium]